MLAEVRVEQICLVEQEHLADETVSYTLEATHEGE